MNKFRVNKPLSDFNNEQKLEKYLVTTHDVSILWHKKLAHVNVNTIGKLVKNNLLNILPKIIFEKNFCD